MPHVTGAATLPTTSHPGDKRTQSAFHLPVEGGSHPLPAWHPGGSGWHADPPAPERAN